MVNDEIILNTIRKMQDAGLSDNIIRSTLSDLGLGNEQVQSFLSRAGIKDSSQGLSFPASPPPPLSEKPNTASRGESNPSLSEADHEAIASRTSEVLQQQMAHREQSIQNEHSLRDSITHLALEQHGEQLKDTHSAVVELHDRLDGMNIDTLSSRLAGLGTRTDVIANDVSEIKSRMGALNALMQKVLETEQKLLFGSKDKK
ncbi:MAG: hypothetical protein Q8P05_04485 [Candidatus Diapherotrites archaeon]|nr:hypothetical protein [Candidatus Diapherotrites archaeon]